MTAWNKQPNCSRVPTDKEQLVADAQFGADEIAVLAIARYYFQTFQAPESHSWVRASDLARCLFADEAGVEIAASVLDVVREMRISRRSKFQFSNPECPICAGVLCEPERQLMGMIRGLRKGNQSEAYVNALLVCEGNEIAGLLRAAKNLVNILTKKAEPAPVTPPRHSQPVKG